MGRQQEVMRPTKPPSLPTKVTLSVILLMTIFSGSGTATTDDTFVYAGCSPHKYSSGSQYDANVNSLLTSLLTSSSTSSFTNLTSGTVHGLFQCHPNLPSPSDCYTCVSACVSQLGVICPGSVAAALRLQGCYVRYDNSSTFLGVEDKTVVLNKCGPQLQFDSDELTRLDSVLGYLSSEGGQLFRADRDGDVEGEAECVGGLNNDQCQDCLGQAVNLLKTDCLYAASGDVYLASCYARYTVSAYHAPTRQTGSTNDGETNDGNTQKTLAIIIGIIVVVGLIVFSAAYLRKHCKDKCEK